MSNDATIDKMKDFPKVISLTKVFKYCGLFKGSGNSPIH